MGESFIELMTFPLQANLNGLWVDHQYNCLVVRKFWRVILNDTNWSSLRVFHEKVEQKASLSQTILEEGMKLLFLGRGDPYFMMTLFPVLNGKETEGREQRVREVRRNW